MKQLLAGYGISQVALIVGDIEEAVRKYKGTFGYGPWIGYNYDSQIVKSLTYRGKPSKTKWKFVMTEVGNLNFELIQPISKGDNIFSEFVENHGYGLHHLGYNVDNVQKVIEIAKGYGIEILQEGKGFGQDGDGHFAFLDTLESLGVVIELREPPKRRIFPHFRYE